MSQDVMLPVLSLEDPNFLYCFETSPNYGNLGTYVILHLTRLYNINVKMKIFAAAVGKWKITNRTGNKLTKLSCQMRACLCFTSFCNIVVGWWTLFHSGFISALRKNFGENILYKKKKKPTIRQRIWTVHFHDKSVFIAFYIFNKNNHLVNWIKFLGLPWR